MKRLLWSAIFFTAFIATIYCGPATAQQFSCDSLQKIIKVVAVDPTLQSIKGKAVDESGQDFYPQIILWNTNDDVHAQDILYSAKTRAFHYYAYFLNSGDGKKEFEAVYADMQTCLGTNWTGIPITGHVGKAYRYQNAVSHVVITLANDNGTIIIDVSPDAK